MPPIRGARKSTNVVFASNYADGRVHKRTRGGLTEPPGWWWDIARTMRGRCQDDTGTLPERCGDAARTMPGHCQDGGGTLPERCGDAAKTIPGHCQNDAGTLPGRCRDTARTVVGHCQNDAGTLPGRCRDTARTVVGHCQNDASTWIRIAIWRGPLPAGANLVAFQLEIILETHHFGGGRRICPPDQIWLLFN